MFNYCALAPQVSPCYCWYVYVSDIHQPVLLTCYLNVSQDSCKGNGQYYHRLQSRSVTGRISSYMMHYLCKCLSYTSNSLPMKMRWNPKQVPFEDISEWEITVQFLDQLQGCLLVTNFPLKYSLVQRHPEAHSWKIWVSSKCLFSAFVIVVFIAASCSVGSFYNRYYLDKIKWKQIVSILYRCSVVYYHEFSLQVLLYVIGHAYLISHIKLVLINIGNAVMVNKTEVVIYVYLMWYSISNHFADGVDNYIIKGYCHGRNLYMIKMMWVKWRHHSPVFCDGTVR